MIKDLEKEIEKLDVALETMISEWAPEQYKNLQTIPGIGKQASMILIVKTDAFTKVEHYKQLISLAGMAPKEFQSGSSIRGKVHICKMGGADIRKSIYE
jgi:transposase